MSGAIILLNACMSCGLLAESSSPPSPYSEVPERVVLDAGVASIETRMLPNHGIQASGGMPTPGVGMMGQGLTSRRACPSLLGHATLPKAWSKSRTI